MEVKKWRIYITPQTHIRTTDNEKWMMAEGITDEYLKQFGKKKYDERVLKGAKNPGTPNNYYNRKKVIQRYWEYKRSLKLLSDLEKVELCGKCLWLKFFLPMPASWSKKKRNKMCFELHESRPDADNCAKAVFDALLKEDNIISDFRVTKFWIDTKGFIEITVGELQPAIGYTKYVHQDKIK